MRAVLKYLVDIRVWYALTGVVLAIVAHEAFHIAAHIGHIQKIELFPNIYTIVELTVDTPTLLSHDVEEAIAYTITVLILFLTIIDLYAFSDSRDTRTSNEILFPVKQRHRKASK